MPITANRTTYVYDDEGRCIEMTEYTDIPPDIPDFREDRADPASSLSLLVELGELNAARNVMIDELASMTHRIDIIDVALDDAGYFLPRS